MDAKNIYIGCSTMVRRAVWANAGGENEWKFVGEGEDFHLPDVQNRINEFFSGDHIFFVTDRHNSREIRKETGAQEVKQNIENKAITLCEKDFRKFMMFHYIGVVRQGTVK